MSCFTLCIYLFSLLKTRIWFSITIKFLNFKAYKLHVSSDDTCDYHPWYIWGAYSILNRFEFFHISHENIQGELLYASSHPSFKQDILISFNCFSLDMVSKPLTNIWMHCIMFLSLLKYLFFAKIKQKHHIFCFGFVSFSLYKHENPLMIRF